ncbi:MAG: hypothetical protein IT580_02970 [Verrucomicrobiales bacterium]|nr:hypothetical protein [Verrucomicrobiales bacterium]
MNLNLTLAGESWWLPALGLVSLALVILVWGYARSGPAPVRWACLVLKLLGIMALAFCLLEPMRSSQRARPGSNLFAVVADNSQGLQVRDAGDTETRGQRLAGWLQRAPGDWQETLAQTFDVRRYLFDTRLQGIQDFTELDFNGRATGLGSALKTLGERMKGRPLAGVLLFTDGNATDLHGALPSLEGLPPVYPVVVGKPGALKDVSLSQISVSQSAFEDQPVAIQVEAQAPGFRGERLRLRLRDQKGEVVKEETGTARGGTEATPFALRPKPDRQGVLFYEVAVGLDGGDAAGAARGTEEATLVNNTRVVAVDRGRGPYRILYVSGRPNWEFKFLNRAVAEDTQLQMVALIRVARREPKFEFRGRAGETSNPLFRGFGEQSRDEVARYDQPVMVRLNTKDELELKDGFPLLPADLFAYHAVVLDDVEAAFFSPEQSALLQRFVSERGGGLMMLGGMESFREGDYHRTPIGEMLPVYLDRAETNAPGATVRLDLAREGWLLPWARLRDEEVGERQRLEAMPAFRVQNRVRGVKPGASVVAVAKDEAGHEHPAMAIQRFGRGRTGALMIGDLWRWGMRDATARTDLDKAWRQMMRWLVAESPPRVELTAEPVPNDALGSMTLRVRVRDAAFQPLDGAAVSVEVETIVFGGGASTNTVRLRAEPSTEDAGVYTTTYLPRTSGGFRATASVTNEVGAEVGRAEAGWTSDPASDEFRSLEPNVALLEHIAQKTGGSVVEPGDLKTWAAGMPLRAAPIMETWAYPVWHTALMFGFALACFVAEWGLRRWKGLP